MPERLAWALLVAWGALGLTALFFLALILLAVAIHALRGGRFVP